MSRLVYYATIIQRKNLKKMSKLILHARYWNDNKDWLQASLNHIDAWEADAVVISEGNWDPAWEARSTDGTREALEAYCSKSRNAVLIDNIRVDKNYRNNQAATSNLAMKKADRRRGDWVLIVDCDHFYFSSEIATIKRLIKEEGDTFDYLVHYNNCFFYNLQECEVKKDDMGTKLPYKLLPGCSWIATNHLSIKGKMYRDLPEVRGRSTPIKGMHYEGLRESKRLKDKYRIGNRKHFSKWMHGRRMKNIQEYSGGHPVVAIPVLKKEGWL